MDANEVKRLRQLEVENNRLKKIVAERDLEIEHAGMHGDIARAAELLPKLTSIWQDFLRHPKVVECLSGEAGE